MIQDIDQEIPLNIDTSFHSWRIYDDPYVGNVASVSAFHKGDSEDWLILPEITISKNNTNSNPNPTYNVAFYGTEDADFRVWRTLYWAANSPQNPPDASDRFSGYFEAGLDKAAEDMYGDILTTYEAKLFTQQKRFKWANKLFQKKPCNGSIPWFPVVRAYCTALKKNVIFISEEL